MLDADQFAPIKLHIEGDKAAKRRLRRGPQLRKRRAACAGLAPEIGGQLWRENSMAVASSIAIKPSRKARSA